MVSGQKIAHIGDGFDVKIVNYETRLVYTVPGDAATKEKDKHVARISLEGSEWLASIKYNGLSIGQKFRAIDQAHAWIVENFTEGFKERERERKRRAMGAQEINAFFDNLPGGIK